MSNSGVNFESLYPVSLTYASSYLALDGVTDDGPAINKLISKLSSSLSTQQEEIIAFPAGKTLALGTTVNRAPFVSLRGENSHIIILPSLKSGPVFTNLISGKMIRSDISGFTIDKGELEGILFDCHSMQNSIIKIKRMIGGGQKCINMSLKCDGEVETDGDAKSNTAFNSIELIDNGICGNHIILMGQEHTSISGGSGAAVVTLNDFHNISARNVYKGGIDCVEWCDDNFWSGMTDMSVKGENAFALRMNGSVTPELNVGVYCNQFQYLTFEAYGESKKRKGIILNYSYETVINNYFASPIGPEGTAFENIHSQSHIVTEIGSPGSTLIKKYETPIEQFEIGSTPSAPASGYVKNYTKNKRSIVLTSDGNEHSLFPQMRKSTTANFSPSSTLETYGSSVAFIPTAGFYSLIPLQLRLTCASIGSETLILRSIMTYSDNSTKEYTKSFTSISSADLTNGEININLYKDAVSLNKIEFSVKSSISNSVATCNATVAAINM